MFCYKCGTKVGNHMKFCPKCGASIAEKVQKLNRNQMRTAQWRCENCNSVMKYEPNKQVLVCPHCGASAVMLQSEKLQAEKIKSQTFERLELEKMRYQERMQQNRINSVKSFFTSIGGVIVDILTLIVLMISITSAVISYKEEVYSAFALGVFQIALLIAAEMMNRKQGAKKYAILCLIVAFVLLLPISMLSTK